VSNRTEIVDGTLTNDAGDTWTIEFTVLIAVLSEDYGPDLEEIANESLPYLDVPDGEYILEYFCLRSQRKRIRVRGGIRVQA
jgi:hypothetical protein